MIDLHSHLLPGIDDGARTQEQALGVLGHFARDGIEQVVCTPHLRASDVTNGRAEAILERRDRLLAALRSADRAGVTLHPGFEIMLDEPLPISALGDRRLSLAGSRYYLVEFPTSVVAEFARQVLARMAELQVVPVVAHPERYAACAPGVIAGWRDAGARIQVDATTLTRPSERGVRARALLTRGLVDVLAADNHGDSRTMRRAVEFLAERAGGTGRDVAELLTRANPRAVLRDEVLQPVPSLALEEKFMERLKRLFGGGSGA